MDGDPYPQIKSLIEGELEQVTSLQGAVYSGQQSAIQSVSRALHSVEEQLSALEDAVRHMVAEPGKYGLRPSTAYQRQVEVESLRFQATELQKAFDGVTATKGPAPSKPAAKPAVAPSRRDGQNDIYARDLDQAETAIQLTMKRQDEELDHISLHVDQIKGVSHSIHEELEAQARLLDDVNEDVDLQQMRIRALRGRVNEIIKKSGGNTQLCIILVLIVVLVILSVFAFS